MTCHEFQNRLSAYMDGEFSGWTRWKVQNHLRFCPHCAELLRDLSEVDSALLCAARETDAPEYLTPSVMRRLPSMPPAVPARRGLRPWAAGLAVAAAQVVALFGAYWWGFAHGTGVRPGGTMGSALPTPPGARSPAAGPLSQPGGSPAVADMPGVHRGVLASPGKYPGFNPAAYVQQEQHSGPGNAPQRRYTVPLLPAQPAATGAH